MAGVTVIGAGLAGLSAALTLARAGVPCTLVSAQRSERAQSVMAEGGINAALDLHGEQDSPAQHVEDTLRSAAGLADPEAVRGMCQAAPDIVRDLVGLGVPFQVEGGHMVQRYFGGQKKRRTAYAKSSTGKALVSSLVDAVRRYEAEGLVTRLASHSACAFDVRDGSCRGVWVEDALSGGLTWLPAPVILCTGGYGGAFGPVTTGTTTNTGDVTALALASGVELANLEFVQYHPTTAAIPGKRMLVSEAARGEGGRLCAIRDGRPWYFMEERYPELGNLMPRDVVSREVSQVLADPSCTGRVFLDMRALPKGVWRARLSDLREECVHWLGVDPARELLPVEPGFHYSMGGIRVDLAHRSSMPGLLAAGECSCQYHGANRLGGNSLLGAIYGGRVAARSAMGEAPSRDICGIDAPGSAEGASPAEPACTLAGPDVVIRGEAVRERQVQDVLARSLGIVRTEEQLRQAWTDLEGISLEGASLRLRNRVLLARAAVLSALARTESRGAHFRADFPQRDDAFGMQTVVRLENPSDGGDRDFGLLVGFEDFPTFGVFAEPGLFSVQGGAS